MIIMISSSRLVVKIQNIIDAPF